jgi:hypothetical protein
MTMRRVKFRGAALMVRGIDGDAQCIDDGKMSLMYGRLDTKLGYSIDMPRDRRIE